MGTYTKSIVVFLGMVIGVFVVYLDDNAITAGEWPLIVSEIASLIGVYFLPNTKNGENVNRLADEAIRNRVLR